jgi:undecaprenyl-diphosphatase
MSFLDAFFIALIEGLTEFLPVSSTGHMMIATALLGIPPTDFIKLFTVAIQLGAILSVVVIYFKYFFKSVGFYMKLLVAFIPSAIAGLLFGDLIDAALENVFGVGICLLVGGIILLFVDKWFAENSLNKEEDITYVKALKIGMFQCIALFPGISRSGATIVGGMTQKLTRQNAAEFSFFLAVPTMFAATAKKLLDFFNDGLTLNKDEITLLLFGNVVAFVVAILAIKFFIGVLNKYGFRGFGWYRIVLGIVLVILFR